MYFIVFDLCFQVQSGVILDFMSARVVGRMTWGQNGRNLLKNSPMCTHTDRTMGDSLWTCPCGAVAHGLGEFNQKLLSVAKWAIHGSWNVLRPVGPVVEVPTANGEPGKRSTFSKYGGQDGPNRPCHLTQPVRPSMWKVWPINIVDQGCLKSFPLSQQHILKSSTLSLITSQLLLSFTQPLFKNLQKISIFFVTIRESISRFVASSKCGFLLF